MKKERVAQIALFISMYLPFIIIVMAMLLTHLKIGSNTFTTAIFIIGLLFIGVSFIIGLINVVFAIINIFNDVASPTKSTILVKLVLIPWYFLNLLVWLLIIAGFLNPWLMLGIPIVICAGISFTYAYLFFTNVHNFSYVIKLVKEKKIQLSTSIVISIVFHFVFVLDILGSILLHKEIQKTETSYKRRFA